MCYLILKFDGPRSLAPPSWFPLIPGSPSSLAPPCPPPSLAPPWLPLLLFGLRGRFGSIQPQGGLPADATYCVVVGAAGVCNAPQDHWA